MNHIFVVEPATLYLSTGKLTQIYFSLLLYCVISLAYSDDESITVLSGMGQINKELLKQYKEMIDVGIANEYKCKEGSVIYLLLLLLLLIIMNL